MNTLRAIMSRRSIRQYTDQPVSDNDLQTILEAAMNAPSAGDGRPWHFVVVKDREKLDAIAEQVDNGNDMFKQAQAAILICGDERIEGFKGYYPQDCSCAAQNLQLAVHDLGLATVWIAVWGVEPRINGVKNILKVPDTVVPFAIFPIGYGAENLEEEYRFDATRVHYDAWGEQK